MKIVKRRYFAMFMGAQRKWLNKMAGEGYKLVRVGKLEYEFEECEPGKYVYEVEFVGDKSFEHEKEYKAFLEDFGYTVFYKNINLDYSMGKVSMRPFAEKGGRISTKQNTYDRELLIIGKENDGRPFELHSTPADKINYLRRIRNPWIFMTAVLAIPAALLLNLVLILFTLLCAIFTLRMQWLIHECQKESAGTDAGGKTGESAFMKVFVPLVLLLTIAAFILGRSGIIKPSPNHEDGIFKGNIENQYRGVFNMTYRLADGEVVRVLKPQKDAKEIRAEIEAKSGSVQVTVKNEGGDVLYTSPAGMGRESVTIPTEGEMC